MLISVNFPFLRAFILSIVSTVLKAQQAPQLNWFLTGVTMCLSLLKCNNNSVFTEETSISSSATLTLPVNVAGKWLSFELKDIKNISFPPPSVYAVDVG